MFGIWAQGGDAYLILFAISTTLFFVVPLFFVPLAWARMMQWRLPQEEHLAVYFGRCLGAFALIVEVLTVRGAYDSAHRVVAFEVLFMVFGLMLAVHIYGALRRIQPITETLEIGFWAILLLLNAAFSPAGVFQ